MKTSNALIAVGVLFVVAGIIGLVHPQWEGHKDEMQVKVAGQDLIVATRKIVDVPPLLSGAVIVAGVCVFGLGLIGKSKPKHT